MVKNYIVASVLLGSMLAGHAHAVTAPHATLRKLQDVLLPTYLQDCWQTDSCYDGYYDPNDLNGLDYYVDDFYADDDFEGKWVSTDEYHDTYSSVDPQDRGDCWFKDGYCFDGYYDANDPLGLDYYVDDWYVDDDFEGKWVSTDEYNDYYAWYHPEEYVG